MLFYALTLRFGLKIMGFRYKNWSRIGTSAQTIRKIRKYQNQCFFPTFPPRLLRFSWVLKTWTPTDVLAVSALHRRCPALLSPFYLDSYIEHRRALSTLLVYALAVVHIDTIQ